MPAMCGLSTGLGVCKEFTLIWELAHPLQFFISSKTKNSRKEINMWALSQLRFCNRLRTWCPCPLTGTCVITVRYRHLYSCLSILLPYFLQLKFEVTLSYCSRFVSQSSNLPFKIDISFPQKSYFSYHGWCPRRHFIRWLPMVVDPSPQSVTISLDKAISGQDKNFKRIWDQCIGDHMLPAYCSRALWFQSFRK